MPAKAPPSGPAAASQGAQGEPVEPADHVAAAQAELPGAAIRGGAAAQKREELLPAEAVGAAFFDLALGERLRGGRGWRADDRGEGRGDVSRGGGGRGLRDGQGEAAEVEAVRLQGKVVEAGAVRRRGRCDGGALGAGHGDRGARGIEGEGPEVDESPEPHDGVEGAAVRAPGGEETVPPGGGASSVVVASRDVQDRDSPCSLAVEGEGGARPVGREARLVVDLGDGGRRELGHRAGRELHAHDLREAVTVAHRHGPGAVRRRIGVAEVGLVGDPAGLRPSPASK